MSEHWNTLIYDIILHIKHKQSKQKANKTNIENFWFSNMKQSVLSMQKGTEAAKQNI